MNTNAHLKVWLIKQFLKSAVMLGRSPSPAAACDQASCKEASSRLLLFAFMQHCRQEGEELQIVLNLFLCWRKKFPCKNKIRYVTWQQRTKEAFSSITIWFCTNFLLQMVSEELLIRRNCCSLHVLLCYALNLSYSPHELPKMQKNCIDYLNGAHACSGCPSWLGLQQSLWLVSEMSHSPEPSGVPVWAEHTGGIGVLVSLRGAVFENIWGGQVLAIRSIYLFPI